MEAAADDSQGIAVRNHLRPVGDDLRPDAVQVGGEPFPAPYFEVNLAAVGEKFVQIRDQIVPPAEQGIARPQCTAALPEQPPSDRLRDAQCVLDVLAADPFGIGGGQEGDSLGQITAIGGLHRHENKGELILVDPALTILRFETIVSEVR